MTDATDSMPARRAVEAWAEAKATPAWVFSAARAHARWVRGAECTEAEFDAAIERARNVLLGGGS
jgi:hypothetical protein